jgi:hypothetical protein
MAPSAAGGVSRAKTAFFALRSYRLLISALKSKLFPAEDRQPKTWFSVAFRRFAAASA